MEDEGEWTVVKRRGGGKKKNTSNTSNTYNAGNNVYENAYTHQDLEVKKIYRKNYNKKKDTTGYKDYETTKNNNLDQETDIAQLKTYDRSFINKVKELRRTKNWDQRDLAKQVNVPFNVIRDLESNKKGAYNPKLVERINEIK
tara:strand:- start:207 stop:635 length:429 start_codon:yes stop_codon:yes gene_type:complete